MLTFGPAHFTKRQVRLPTNDAFSEVNNYDTVSQTSFSTIFAMKQLRSGQDKTT